MPYPLKELIFLALISSLVLAPLFLLYASVKWYDNFVRYQIKKKIVRNPSIGHPKGNAFVYEERGYEYRYRIQEPDLPGQKQAVEWLSRYRRESPKGGVSLLVSLLLGAELDPKIVVGILFLTVSLCLNFFVPGSLKETLVAQAVARITGIQEVQVMAEADGWVRLKGIRVAAAGRRPELFEVRVRPLDWIVFGKPAAATRYRDQPYGPVTYEIYHDALGWPVVLKGGRLLRIRREGKNPAVIDTKGP